MANPKDPGTFDYWITDRLTFSTLPPKSGNTGTFDYWIADRQYFLDYVETEAVTTGHSLVIEDNLSDRILGGFVVR